MKVLAKLHNLDPEKVGAELIATLQGIAPSESSLYYRAKMEETDPRWRHLLRAVEDAGLREWDMSHVQDEKTEYSTSYTLVYDAADVGSSPYVRFDPAVILTEDGFLCRQEPIVCELDHEELQGVDFAVCQHTSGMMGGRIVSNRAKIALEAAGPAALSFHNISICIETDDMSVWDRVGGPWWLMEFPVKLPHPLPPAPEQKRFWNPDYRYHASTLSAFGHFDAAWVLHPNFSDVYESILSKRLFDVCIANDLKGVDWFPVRVEDG